MDTVHGATHLAMHVADNLDGRTELDQRGLAEEHFARGRTHAHDLCILQRRTLCDFAAVAGLEQTLDHAVDVEDLEACGGGARAEGATGDGLGERVAGGEVGGGLVGGGARGGRGRASTWAGGAGGGDGQGGGGRGGGAEEGGLESVAGGGDDVLGGGHGGGRGVSVGDGCAGEGVGDVRGGELLRGRAPQLLRGGLALAHREE